VNYESKKTKTLASLSSGSKLPFGSVAFKAKVAIEALQERETLSELAHHLLAAHRCCFLCALLPVGLLNGSPEFALQLMFYATGIEFIRLICILRP